jgi:hypothetical protein
MGNNKGKGLGGHERTYEGVTNEWLTPLPLIQSLGQFDLDPCSPIKRPWDTAINHYNELDDGLIQRWDGRVWMNPPYGPHTKKWLKKMCEHNNGVVLIFARTETQPYFDYIWGKISSILFLKGRIRFFTVDGVVGPQGAGAPSVLLSYDSPDSLVNHDAIKNSGITGEFISFRK